MAAAKRLDADELRNYLDELEKLPRFDISPTEAAPALGCDAYALNVAAKSGNLGSIGHFFAGNRLRLSRLDVLAFCGRHPMEVCSVPFAHGAQEAM